MTDLADATTTDVASSPPTVALVPTGSTEQHGPALPLGTDTLTAMHFAGVAAAADGVVRTPPVAVGVSAHHRHFDGTLWVGEETFTDYVEAIVRSLASHGTRRVVFVNGHGGNVDALARVSRRLRGEGVAAAVTWMWSWALEERLEAVFDEPGGHACHAETSVVMAIDEGLVHRDRLAAAAEGAPPGWGRRHHGGELGVDTIDFTPTGAVGDPTAASTAVGEELVAEAGEELRSLVAWLADRPLEALLEHARPLHPTD